LAELPPAFREVVVLREIEGLSYRDIAKVTGAPIGTVMSRLARGRRDLRQALIQLLAEDEPTAF
jgi:RNA polymerase sigma-70 factor (ECF subfamily)